MGTGSFRTISVLSLSAARAVLALYLLAQRMSKSYSGKIFDAVLQSRGITSVKPASAADMAKIKDIAEEQQPSAKSGGQRRSLTGKLVSWGLRTFGQRIVTAPLLLVPGVGWAAWLYTNAFSEGA